MYDFSKDGITISAMLDTRRETDAGDYPIKIRVTYRRDRKYYGTGKRMTKAEWEKLPSSKSKGAIELRETIHNSFDIVKIAVEDLASNAEFSFDALNARLRKAASGSIGTAITARVAELKADQPHRYDALL